MNIKLIALGAGGLITLMGVVSGQEEMNARQATRDQLTSLQQSAAINAAQAKVAMERQSSGRCIFIEAMGKNEYTAVSDGLTVADRSQGAVLGNGAIVCDPWGGTGEIQNGRVVNYANGQPIQPNTPTASVKPQEEPQDVIPQAQIK